MKRVLILLFCLCMLSIGIAEGTGADIDLTALSGDVLADRLAEIRGNPEAYAGMTVRVQGQHYGWEAEGESRHSLIVCGSCMCTEVGITLFPAGDAGLDWPENNRQMIVTGTVEMYENSLGVPTARLAVFSVEPVE